MQITEPKQIVMALQKHGSMKAISRAIGYVLSASSKISYTSC